MCAVFAIIHSVRRENHQDYQEVNNSGDEDFDDYITATTQVPWEPQTSPYVLCKLDNGSIERSTK
jgi:hypothetical protein